MAPTLTAAVERHPICFSWSSRSTKCLKDIWTSTCQRWFMIFEFTDINETDESANREVLLVLSSQSWCQLPITCVLYFLRFICVCVFLGISMCTICAQVLKEIKGAHLDPLDLKLQVFVSHHVGTGNQSQALCKKENSLPLSCLFSPMIMQHFF